MERKVVKNLPTFGQTRRISGSSSGCRPSRWARSGSELKLRGEDGNPTAQALCQGYCTPTPLKDGTPFFLWNRQQVEELMRAHGYQRLDPQEVKARELADSWVQVHKQWQEAIYSVILPRNCGVVKA